jgi:hypothetical protein
MDALIIVWEWLAFSPPYGDAARRLDQDEDEDKDYDEDEG